MTEFRKTRYDSIFEHPSSRSTREVLLLFLTKVYLIKSGYQTSADLSKNTVIEHKIYAQA